MPNLVIDIGNSSVKLAVFDADNIVYRQSLQAITTDFVAQLIGTKSINNIIVSSVKDDFGFDEEIISSKTNYIKFNAQTKIPIDNRYQSPETLGLDRLAAVIGANYLYPNQAVLTIDAGTCITYDSINANGEYYGGSISPGIKMRFDAMHHFTSKLPRVNFDATFNERFGTNSKDAISSGAINGSVYEAEGFIKTFLSDNPSGKIILSGGDSTFFDTKFKNSIFANLILHEPNLVLIGLNTVVNYQHDLK
ncbi:MAG TPA: type III pantothenate kinase [Pelobium sp.]|nr:type III pantothenate kinase [Pelobium sp.]